MEQYERGIFAAIDRHRADIDRARSCHAIDTADERLADTIAELIAKLGTETRYNALAFAHREIDTVGDYDHLIWTRIARQVNHLNDNA